MVAVIQDHSRTHLSRRCCHPKSDLPRAASACPGFRYYSPEMGRWLSRDPIGEPSFARQVAVLDFLPQRRPANQLLQVPVYIFVANAPTHLVDFLGLWNRDTYIKDRCTIPCCPFWTRVDSARACEQVGSLRARDLVRRRGGDRTGHDTEALFHCIASGMLATRVGCRCSECIGSARETWQDTHEYDGHGPQTSRDSERDRRNNRAGRTCGGCFGAASEKNPEFLKPPVRSQAEIESCCLFGLDNNYLDTTP
jgi:hypothetical protein